jgi:hypothetical protein
MKQVELRLIPAPGAKPEFLATMEATTQSTTPTNSIWERLTDKVVVLEGHTRDAWALDTSCKWHAFQVTSVDGRNKLPGFVKYLRERQKTAYGRFGDDQVWVISNKQVSNWTLNCRVAALSTIPHCPLLKVKQPAAAAAAAQPTATATPTTSKKKKGFGFLGNLVGAQKRTNQQVEIAAVKKVSAAAPAAAGGGGDTAPSTGPNATNTNTTTNNTNTSLELLKTAGQVLADFRSEMEQEMLDFDASDEPLLKVPLDVASKLRTMSESEQQSGRVTMEILKYIVYEQAEEVNENWIQIYKEGEAPPEVLEDMNKAEVPDEVRGQQQAIQQQRQKMELQRAQKDAELKQKAALRGEQNADDEEDFAVLNTKKRDRRTIEEIQLGTGKRRK